MTSPSWILLTLLLAPAVAAPQSLSDPVREQRWADQIVPSLVVGDAVQLLLADGTRFLGLLTLVERPRGAVLLLHHTGLHPDHGLIGELRASLPDRGYATLSIQMPVTRLESESLNEMLKLFPEAMLRIAAGIRLLQDKGFKRVAIVSHTMGTAMAGRYLRERLREVPVSGWVAMTSLGRMEGFAGAPFPIFDLYGGSDFRDARGFAGARKRVLDTIPGSRQLAAPDGGRALAGGEKTVLKEVPDFLDSLKP